MVVQAQAAQMVYRFSEGDASMGDLLGGKGSNLCEMTRRDCRSLRGSSSRRRSAAITWAGDYTLPEGLAGTIRERISELEESIGHGVRLVGRPAAGVGALRRPHLDAGDDGHHPQFGHQRRDC